MDEKEITEMILMFHIIDCWFENDYFGCNVKN